MTKVYTFLILLIFLITVQANDLNQRETKMMDNKEEIAILGGGCFWCVEAVFERIEGVSSVVSGYAGGLTENPSYKEVTSGKTGHAEVCKISFNPKIVSFDEILDIFWQAHDPTTLNRQGNDKGTQYRSAIYYIGDSQKNNITGSIEKAKKLYSDPIITEVKEMDKFYKAEGYHQDYFENNPNAPYCAFVIAPKIKKLGKKGLWDN